MCQFSAVFALLSFFFLSALSAPLPLGHSLSKRYSGQGTYFYDGLGACGFTNSASDPIVAISAQMYGSGGYCGTWVSITNTGNGKKAYGLMHDRCEGCGQGDLDMSTGLFQELGELSAGVLPITWDFMPQGWAPS